MSANSHAGHWWVCGEGAPPSPAPLFKLRGVDLYNHGFGWEAHEAWESMWHRPADSTQAAWLQALIQLAAATVQESIGHPDGRARLCRGHSSLGCNAALTRGPL